MAAVNDTLFVRCLPAELTQEENEDLLKHFGASCVRSMPESGRMKNSAFAVFASEKAAQEALVRLHQLDVLGNRLVVQFARHQQKQYFPHLGDFKKPNLKSATKENESSKSKTVDFHKQIEAMQRNINSLSMLFGLNYPINPKLRYSYPKPTETILTNIVHTLISVPKFYTQVLHLMNKLNLPAPFGEETPLPPLNDENEHSSESELESDEENKSSAFGVKRLKTRKKTMKKFKIQDMLNLLNKTTPVLTTSLEKKNIFEMPDTQTSKKIEFKLNLETITKNPEEEMEKEAGISESGFGQFAPVQSQNEQEKIDGRVEEVYAGSDFTSRDEIRRKKLSKQEMNSNSVFRSYNAGEVTSRLYIKNLSKEVNEVDLKKVYGFYVDEKSEEEKLRFDIRLMKEGRMKGQAFVTLPNEEKAKSALEDTNGYVLYGKPFVVHFARSAKPKEVPPLTE
uniref:RNA-binding region-containing protein 3 n=1 Tax=Strigamia maritima TaxID=126957 RepID=T1J0A5_STRMM